MWCATRALRARTRSPRSKREVDALLRSVGFTIARRRRYAWTFSAHYLVSRFSVFRGWTARRGASFLKRIPIKLALGDSFEIYAVKDKSV